MNDENRWNEDIEESSENVIDVEEKSDEIIDIDIKVEEQEQEQKPESEPYFGYTPRYDYDYSQVVTGSKPENKTKGFGPGKIILIAILVVVFALLSVVGIKSATYFMERYGYKNNENETDSNISSTQISKGSGDIVESDVADVAENVMPAVVSITNLSIQEVQSFFFGGVQQYESQSSGSGIIIGKNETELLIVTNNHVVAESKTLTVTFIDGSSHDARIKGTDSDKDLAVISIPLSSLKKETLDVIKIATLGDSNVLRVGEPAIAIGNALGYGQSVTTGIISALGRTIEGMDGQLIQTDAAINPGNSGGALLNANGEVIGINTAKVSADAVEGMGYAIPISDVTDILNDLSNQKSRTKVPKNMQGALGISCLDVTEELSKYYNMPEGVYVKEIQKNGGADKAGLPLNSIITKVGKKTVHTTDELVEELQYHRKGETISITYYVLSDGEYVKKTLDIKLQ